MATGFPPELNLGDKNTPLMSFKHLRMLNSASKCYKITLKVIKICKTRKNISQKSSS
jgi:hypothetical protein